MLCNREHSKVRKLSPLLVKNQLQACTFGKGISSLNRPSIPNEEAAQVFQASHVRT